MAKKSEIIFVLHAYQPPYPIQEPEVVRRIVQNTYRPFVEEINRRQHLKIVLNVQGCLTQILCEEYPDIVDQLRKAIDDGKIELLDSACYHPIMPLIDSNSRQLQIEEHRTFNNKAYGLKGKRKGFWPPEQAISTEVVKELAKEYDAIICPSNTLFHYQPGRLYAIRNQGKRAFLLCRDKGVSNRIAFRQHGGVESVVSEIRYTCDKIGVPLVLAMDIETFGEHQRGYFDFFFSLLNHRCIRSVGTDALSGYHVEEKDEIASTTWSTDDEDRNRGIAFPLWNHPQNAIHQTQHAHMALLIAAAKISNAEKSWKYLAAQHSCQFWWAHGFGHMWSPGMIRKGFDFQQTVLDDLLLDIDDVTAEAIASQSRYLSWRLDETLRTR